MSSLFKVDLHLTYKKPINVNKYVDNANMITWRSCRHKRIPG